MKKTLIVICCSLFAVACGNSNDGKSKTSDSSATSSNTPSVSSGSAEKALEIIGSSDCKTCHKLHEADNSVQMLGPSYDKVAAKYGPNPADSTVDRIVKKIISGGNGVWGTTAAMTPHPQVSEDDLRTVVKYIMTIK